MFPSIPLSPFSKHVPKEYLSYIHTTSISRDQERPVFALVWRGMAVILASVKVPGQSVDFPASGLARERIAGWLGYLCE
jgi:hypothetical protein